MMPRFVFSILAVSALSGCHSNLYSTPRTVPVGKTQHIVAVDGHTVGESDTIIPPTMVYTVRHGLGDRVDLGFQVSNTLKLDVKINAVRTEYFDLAIDPSISGGVYAVYTASGGFLTMAVPVIMGLNLGERVTVVAQGGPAWTTFGGLDVDPVIGGGVQIRVNDMVMIQPEVSTQLFLDKKPLTCIGIGFGFGPQPHYGRTSSSKR